MSNKQYCTHDNEDSWWEYDARSMPLCLVCEVCKVVKLSAYRGDVLTDPNYHADEPIEEQT